MWPLVMLAMAGAKYGVDQAHENKARTLAAATQRYSPWTGLQAQPVQNANPIGDLAQGAMSGMQMSQGQDMMGSQQNLQQAMADYYRRAGMPANTPPAPSSWNLGDYSFATPSFPSY